MPYYYWLTRRPRQAEISKSSYNDAGRGSQASKLTLGLAELPGRKAQTAHTNAIYSGAALVTSRTVEHCTSPYDVSIKKQ